MVLTSGGGFVLGLKVSFAPIYSFKAPIFIFTHSFLLFHCLHFLAFAFANNSPFTAENMRQRYLKQSTEENNYVPIPMQITLIDRHFHPIASPPSSNPYPYSSPSSRLSPISAPSPLLPSTKGLITFEPSHDSRNHLHLTTPSQPHVRPITSNGRCSSLSPLRIANNASRVTSNMRYCA